jgi:dipeptidyl aminopeptidase/acylaminoacyl peptidase
LFAAAIQCAPHDRGSYLNDACRDDPALRAAVDSLLAAYDSASSFGESPLHLQPDVLKRLAPGTRVGPFVVDAFLGAGGMGEVYRAHDTKLDRDVALKVLPDFFAQNADRRVRFEEEARALAALNHPNIGAIYGLEETGEIAALILELVEGPTLADRLAGGPPPLDEAVRIATQLADGLEAAHDRGIIHRDLKPANIKVTPDRTVKILDFGLAKRDVSIDRIGLETSPGSRHATATGAIVGTIAYMSPEQAQGRPVDKRTDIWAFGCILFEMCAGRPPFSGATPDETLAAVIDGAPEWSLLPSTTPLNVVRLLRRCLSRDAKVRLRDIGEARIALSLQADEPLDPPARKRKRLAGLTVVAAALAAGAGLATLLRPPPAIARVVADVHPPNGGAFTIHFAQPTFALSPDGSQLALLAQTQNQPSASSRSRIWVRSKGAVELRRLEGTDGATSMFWSPDGGSLAFLAGGQLKRISLADSAVVKICDVRDVGHGTWGKKDVILLAMASGHEILSVPVAGGVPSVILAADPERGEERAHWPWFLPDGDQFLYTVRTADGEGQLRIGRLDGTSRFLMPLESNAQFVGPDIVVFGRDSVLMGQRIDLDAAVPVGNPFSIAEHVEYFRTTSRALFSTSRNGDVTYHPGGDLAQYVFADTRTGYLEPVGRIGDYDTNSGRLVGNDESLFTARRQSGPGTYNVVRLDLRRNSEQNITTGRGSELSPVPLEDGRGIVFGGDTGGSVPHLIHRDLATGTERPLLPPGNQQLPIGVLRGDRAVLYTENLRGTGFKLFTLQLTLPGEKESLPDLFGSVPYARLSPGGDTVVLLALGPSRGIYLLSLTSTAPPLLVTDEAAGQPRWSRDGRIYFIGPDEKVKSVAVTTSPALHAGPIESLFAVKPGTALVDVAKDGRLLLLVPHTRAADVPIVWDMGAIESAKR